MHMDEERLQHFADGELDAAAEGMVRAHVDQCDVCRTRLAAIEAERAGTLALLETLDSPAPRVSPEMVIERAQKPPQWHRWAAGIVLTAGAAGVAYALPNSPVAGWFDALTGRTASDSSHVAGARADHYPSGVAIEAGKFLIVVLDALPPHGEVRISLIEGDDVDVRVSSDEASFTFGVDSLLIRHPGDTDTVLIAIPRSASHVQVVIADRVAFDKRESNVVTSATQDQPGIWVVPPR